jgi:glycosyltransferase involved in cell wall biosynthesis
MTGPNARPHCLVYLHHSYTGRGPAESCVQIVSRFAEAGLETTLFVTRARRPIPSTVNVRTALPRVMNLLPWRLVRKVGKHLLDRRFAKALADTSRPGIAFFWPGADLALVERARANGWITVREMTNRTLAAAKASLDNAYRMAERPEPVPITDDMVASETLFLEASDFIFSSNGDVDASLRLAGVSEGRLLQTTFGWSEEKFSGHAFERPEGGGFRVGYLGTISVGKGILDLLEAWRQWNGEGELVLAGPIDGAIRADIDAAIRADSRISAPGFVADIGSFFAGCDVVIIPTLDEGGPQVTYEAAAAGAAIIATPMARARMLEDGRNALIVPCHDPAGLATRLDRLARDRALRLELGRNAFQDAGRFTYQAVGISRARQLLAKLAER